MKKLFIIPALLLASACSAQNINVTPPAAPVPTGSVLVHCTYKYDATYNITFLESNKVEYHPKEFPNLLEYHIVDVYGKHWSVNQYDWLNYNCTSDKK